MGSASWRWVKRVWVLLRHVGVRFYEDDCLTRASALAYTSLLSLVPFLAVVFAVLKGLGFPRRIEPYILQRFALPPETMATIIDAIERTNVGVLGVAGAALLVLSVMSVLGSIEAALNHVWRVPEGRRGWRRVSDYLGLVLLTPFLLLAAIALTSSLRLGHVVHLAERVPFAGELVRWSLSLVPVVLNTVGLAVLYALLPNRRPNWKAVAFGAFVAGALWQLVQWGYVSLQIGVARYSALYGALAQLPITLVWLYASWAVFLFGAEVAVVAEWGAADVHERRWRRSTLALQVLSSVWAAFLTPQHRGVDPLMWARQYGVASSEALDLFRTMAQWGWLQCSGDREQYTLARHPRTFEWNRLAQLDCEVTAQRLDDAVVQWGEELCRQVEFAWTKFWESDVAGRIFGDAARGDDSRNTLQSSGKSLKS